MDQYYIRFGNFEIKDTIHDGSMKVIKSGVRLLAKSISEYFNKKLISYKQDSSMEKLSIFII